MLFLASVLSLSAARASDKYAYPAQRISLRGVHDLKISGVKGTLKLRGHGQHKSRFLTLKVQHSKSRRYEDWHLSVDRQGSTIALEVFNVSYGLQWRKFIREDKWPEFDIEIDAPEIPANVSWREGHIEVTNWRGDLDVSLLKGEIRAQGGHGKFNLQPVQANVDLINHKGAVNVRGESGRVRLARLTGDISLNWVNGPLWIHECRGNVQVEMQTGQATITGLQGRLKGRSASAKWDVQAAAPAEMNVSSVSGPIDVAWGGGGAKVFLTSENGAIHFPRPSFLQSSEREGKHVVQGVKTAKTMGQIFVQSRGGAITWR